MGGRQEGTGTHLGCVMSNSLGINKKLKKKKYSALGMVAHVLNPSTSVAEAIGSLRDQGQADVLSEVLTSQVYTARLLRQEPKSNLKHFTKQNKLIELTQCKVGIYLNKNIKL